MASRKSWAQVAVAATALLLSAFAPVTAQARWLKAESPRFVVYSDGDERDLREYVRKLETFDALLRLLHGIPAEAPAHRRLPVYLLRNQAQLRQVYLGAGSGVRGFYLPSTEDVFAVALRQGGEDDYLLHEYVHHFMLANFPYAYPAWLVEGYAEYFMTATVDDEHVTWGQFNDIRAAWLVGASWLPTETVLARYSSELRRERDASKYYAQAWLITHYFMSDSGRRAQLDAYVRAVGGGEDPVRAMEKAAGMPVASLHRALGEYADGRISYSRMPAARFRAPDVVVTQLGPVADDLLLLSLRLKVPHPANRRAQSAELVRKAAARHADDPFARVTLAHAELHFGDRAKGEQILAALLKEQPDHVEALQWMAMARLTEAGATSDAARAKSLRGQARAFLARAYRADDANYVTLMLLAQSREPEADYPNANDLETWRLAHALAPQVSAIRMGAARAMMLGGRREEAIGLLEPIANNPHGGRMTEYAEDMLARARRGEAPPALGREAEEAAAADDAGDAADTPPSGGEAGKS